MNLVTAQQNVIDALIQLALLHEQGEVCPQDFKRARHLLELASNDVGHGCAEAEYTLGMLHRDGMGGPSDHNKAHELFFRAAEKDHTGAQYCLGLMHYMGKVCPPDYYKARALFSLAARKGHTGAQLRIDVMCLDAEEASRNYERTVTGTTVTTGEIDREGAKMTTQFERTHGQDDVRGNAAALVYGAETENTQLKMAQELTPTASNGECLVDSGVLTELEVTDTNAPREGVTNTSNGEIVDWSVLPALETMHHDELGEGGTEALALQEQPLKVVSLINVLDLAKPVEDFALVSPNPAVAVVMLPCDARADGSVAEGTMAEEGTVAQEAREQEARTRPLQHSALKKWTIKERTEGTSDEVSVCFCGWETTPYFALGPGNKKVRHARRQTHENSRAEAGEGSCPTRVDENRKVVSLDPFQTICCEFTHPPIHPTDMQTRMCHTSLLCVNRHRRH